MSGKTEKFRRKLIRELEMDLRVALREGDPQEPTDREGVMLAAGALNVRDPGNKELVNAKTFLESFRVPFNFKEISHQLAKEAIGETGYTVRSALRDYVDIRQALLEDQWSDAAEYLNEVRKPMEGLAFAMSEGHMCRVCPQAARQTHECTVREEIQGSTDEMSITDCPRFTPYILLKQCNEILKEARLDLGDNPASADAGDVMHHCYFKADKYGGEVTADIVRRLTTSIRDQGA